MFPNRSATSVCVPRVSHSHLPPLQETFQDQQAGLAQAPIKLLLLPWVLVCMRFCVCPLRAKSLFPPVPWGSLHLSSTGLQSQCSGGSFPWCRSPGLGSLAVGLRTLTPGGEPLQYNYSPVCGSPTPGVWDLITSRVYWWFHLVVPSLPFVVEDVSW